MTAPGLIQVHLARAAHAERLRAPRPGRPRPAARGQPPPGGGVRGIVATGLVLVARRVDEDRAWRALS
jgi:hypothetical protein